jgi:hypothetical protein
MAQRSTDAIKAIAIFPKQFELQGFLSSLGSENYLVANNDDDKRECYHVIVRIAESELYLGLHCYVINSSDIEFSFDLGKLLEDTRKELADSDRNRKLSQNCLCFWLVLQGPVALQTTNWDKLSM